MLSLSVHAGLCDIKDLLFRTISQFCYFSEITLNNPKYPLISAVNKDTNGGKAQIYSAANNKMQIPPLDRTMNLRPVAAELASMAVAQVIPVAPVNPSVNASSPIESSPSVINMVGRGSNATATQTGEGVYASVSDPTRRGSEAATSPKDWTIQRPEPEKVEDPLPPPMSKVLLDHIKSLWTASASAVQVQQEVRNHIDPDKQDLTGVPGTLAAETLTYSPSKINKTADI